MTLENGGWVCVCVLGEKFYRKGSEVNWMLAGGQAGQRGELANLLGNRPNLSVPLV